MFNLDVSDAYSPDYREITVRVQSNDDFYHFFPCCQLVYAQFRDRFGTFFRSSQLWKPLVSTFGVYFLILFIQFIFVRDMSSGEVRNWTVWYWCEVLKSLILLSFFSLLLCSFNIIIFKNVLLYEFESIFKLMNVLLISIIISYYKFVHWWDSGIEFLALFLTISVFFVAIIIATTIDAWDIYYPVKIIALFIALFGTIGAYLNYLVFWGADYGQFMLFGSSISVSALLASAFINLTIFLFKQAVLLVYNWVMITVFANSKNKNHIMFTKGRSKAITLTQRPIIIWQRKQS